MTVNPVGGGGTPAAKSPAQGLAANFDSFLKLLTTQLETSIYPLRGRRGGGGAGSAG